MASSAPLNPQEGGQSLPMKVHVRAPSNLPAGYTFDAEINGDPRRTFSCQVPEGGVEEGDLILVTLPHSYHGERLKAPTGRWKDGLFSGFFAHGIFHPVICLSTFCTQIAMGQVIRRMELTWLGEPDIIANTKQAFAVVVTLFFSFLVYCTALELAALPYERSEAPAFIHLFRFVGNFLFTFWCIYSLCRTRESVRTRYQIPEDRQWQGCEDLVCATACSCCVAAQMLRHTGEYETYPAVCCSPTGHPAGTPLVV